MATFNTINESYNVREDFMSILLNLGGAMTFKQAQKVLKTLDSARLPDHKYNPTVYLMPDIEGCKLSIDRQRGLIGLYSGSKRKDVPYDKAALWGISLALDFIDNPDDLTSLRLYKDSLTTLDFTFNGKIYKVIYANHSSIPQVAQILLETEKKLQRSGMNVDLIRPRYMFLVTDTEKNLRDLAFERLEQLDVQYPHTIVIVAGGYEFDQPQFEYYESESTTENAD